MSLIKPKADNYESNGNGDSENISQVTVEPPLQKPRKNYSVYRRNRKKDIGEYWSNEKFGISLEKIINQTVLLPNQEIQAKMLALYGSIPSGMCDCIPILFLYGSAGSGKSNTARLLAEVHEKTLIANSTTTYAAFRNDLKIARVGSDIKTGSALEEGHEKHFCAVFDNADKRTLDPRFAKDFYNLFLGGYKRGMDKTSISKGEGENLEFSTFGCKIITSIHPIFALPEFNEIKRRIFVIRFKSIDYFHRENPNFEEPDFIDINAITFDHLKTEYYNYSNDDNNLEQFALIQAQLESKRNWQKYTKDLGKLWEMMPDLVATGIVSGLFSSIDEALEFLVFFNKYQNQAGEAIGILPQTILDFISNKKKYCESLSKTLGYPIQLEIGVSELNIHLDNVARTMVFEERVTPGKTAEIMNGLGYQTCKNSSGEWIWKRQ